MKRAIKLGSLGLLWLCIVACRPHKIHPVAQQAQRACARAANMRKLELAKNYCELALRYNPKFAEAYNGLALVEIQQGDYGKAENLLKKALSINSSFADARSNLGHIYYERKDFNRARQLFRSALDIDPQLLNGAGYNLARVLITLRKYAVARNEIIKSIFFPKNRRFPPFHFLLGYIEFERKNYKGAIRHWVEAVQLNPNYIEAQLNLCKALFLISQYGYACFHCKQVLRIDPNNVDGQRSLRTVQIKLREYGQDCQTTGRSL